MQIGPATTFAQISQQTKPTGQFAGVPGEKHLRLSATGDLHTHRTDKWSGIHFLNRAEKHKQAAQAIKQAIDTQAGMAGVGDRVFERLGLGKKVKVSDLAAIKQEIGRAQEDVSRQQVLDKAAPHKGEYAATKSRYLAQMSLLPDVAGTGQPMAHNNAGKDLFRSNIGDDEKVTALDKIGSHGVGSLNAREAAGALKGMFYESVAPLAKLAKLADHEAVPDAVGYFTGRNTVSAKPVGRDAVAPEDSDAAAGRLKQAIDSTLSPAEKAALKQRIDFLVDAAPIMTAKIGLCSADAADANSQDKLWMKSMAVSYPLFLGTTQEQFAAAHGGPAAATLGPEATAAAVKGRDLLTALAIHRDAIFG